MLRFKEHHRGPEKVKVVIFKKSSRGHHALMEVDPSSKCTRVLGETAGFGNADELESANHNCSIESPSSGHLTPCSDAIGGTKKDATA